ncbi:hypothetical protein FRX31_017556 [Thalictrum thalictroides]|uniref:Uncharacterized protein n=1 Tax=Thalictrum thalictroides TaxID=46969 RepID=A0A7J6W8Z3_THATH|nr:hypothetical protein FRX31_017556 [Thalictrum thalictroides]
MTGLISIDRSGVRISKRGTLRETASNCGGEFRLGGLCAGAGRRPHVVGADHHPRVVGVDGDGGEGSNRRIIKSVEYVSRNARDLRETTLNCGGEFRLGEFCASAGRRPRVVGADRRPRVVGADGDGGKGSSRWIIESAGEAHDNDTKPIT